MWALKLSLHNDISLCLHRPCLSGQLWFLALRKQMVEDTPVSLAACSIEVTGTYHLLFVEEG